MSSSESDDPRDFFDLSKPLKKVYLRPGRAFREQEERHRAAAYNFWQNRAKDVNQTEANYYVRFQKEERERMARNVMDSSCASEGPQHCAMSELEADTIGASSVVSGSFKGSSKPTGENLAQKFNLRQTTRTELPITRSRHQILEKIDAYPVTVIQGATGCGKSTQIPQYILDHHAANDNYVNIIVTQPRRLAAQAVAKRVCKERNWHLGGLVGYKVGLDKSNASKDTRLLYVTTGVLIKMLIAKKSMAEWTHVIIDEVHERDKDMDFLLILARKFITSNSQGVKIILMSATLNADKLKNYFTWPLYLNGPNMSHATTYNIPGRTMYGVNVFYLDQIVDGRQYGFKGPTEKAALMESCVTQCRKIIYDGIRKIDKTDERGAVLVFLPGELEITTVLKNIRKFDPENVEKLELLPLHSRLPFESAQKIFDPVRPGFRKVILSTNMAESSVTIPDIAFVIDFCLTKKLISDPTTNYAALQLVWADKNSCEQRKGRAGRVQTGRVYRLVNQDFYERVLLNEHEPEMRLAPLDKVILDTKCLDMGPPKEILALALDPPDLKNIKMTVSHLKDMGALLPTVTTVGENGKKEKTFQQDDGDLTVLGELVAHLPIDVRLGKLVVYGYLFDMLDESIIIAAGLSNKSVFAFPFDKKLIAFANKLLWSNQSFSDCLAVLLAYRVWKDKVMTGYFKRRFNDENEWCRQRYLQMKTLREMDLTIAEIRRSLEQFNIHEMTLPNRQDRMRRKASDNDYLVLKVVLFGAFYPNYFIRSHGTLDMREVHREINDRNPMNTLFLSGFSIDQAKYGELYVNQIKELFKETQPNKAMIDVEFESSKVIVEFRPHMTDQARVQIGEEDIRSVSSRHSLTGQISHHVYVGMRLKSSKDLKVMLYNKSEAANLWEQHSEAVRKLREESTGNEEITDAMSIGQIDPPGMDEYEVTFNVVHVNHPNSFWVNYTDEKHARMAQDVHDAIVVWLKYNDHEGQPKVQHTGAVKVGHIYLAPYSGCYFRVRVDATNPGRNTVTVFFIDYGNVEEVGVQELIIITKKGLNAVGDSVMPLIKVPAMAMECSLSFTKPNSILSDHEEWHSKAISIFENMLVNADGELKVICEIYSVAPGPWAARITATLFNDREKMKKRLSINEEFRQVKDNQNRLYAEFRDESYMSKENFKSRQSQETVFYNPERKRRMEERQKQYFGSQSMEPLFNHLDKKGPLECALKGPYHPLEFSLISAHKIGGQRQIRVEPESVNSVLLDNHPEDNVDQFLIAAHVGMNPSGSALMARATTFMPNKLGLGAILTMTFAPKVELRIEEHGRRYIGCLAGLGHHDPLPRDKGYVSHSHPGLTPYNPEHDMEIRFDAVIDNEDISEINKIRFYIGKALSRIPEAQREGDSTKRKGSMMISADTKMIDFQDSILKSMDKLLFKERQYKCKESHNHDYKWGQMTLRRFPNIDIVKSKVNDDEYFLKMITYAAFKEELELDQAEEIIAELRKLKRLASASTIVTDSEAIPCPLCPVYEQFTHPERAMAHLKSQTHLAKLRELREKFNEF